eukprot:sb/3468372/
MTDFRGGNRGMQGNGVMRPIGPGTNMIPPSKHPVFPSLCPDFMKGVCSAFQCPKNHPEASLLFCQGYQRDCCQLGQTCTYMHATVEEEQYYKDTGLIPLRFMNKPIRIERGKGPLINGQPSLFPSEGTAPTVAVVPEQYTSPEPVSLPEVPPGKRKIPYEELEIEKNMLAEKVRILEKKVEQLDATNELLLEKNAKLRKRSPEGRRGRSPDNRRRGGARGRSRSRSKERGRSKDMEWKGRQWGEGQQYNNSGPNNNFNNRPM